MCSKIYRRSYREEDEKKPVGDCCEKHLAMSGYLSSSFAGVVFWKRIRQQRSQQARGIYEIKDKCAVRAILFPCSSSKHMRHYAVLHACHHRLASSARCFRSTALHYIPAAEILSFVQPFSFLAWHSRARPCLVQHCRFQARHSLFRPFIFHSRAWPCSHGARKGRVKCLGREVEKTKQVCFLISLG